MKLTKSSFLVFSLFCLGLFVLLGLSKAQPVIAQPELASTTISRTNIASFTMTNLTDGLVAYYNFDDDTAADNTENGNDGGINGNVTFVNGVRGKATKFGGIDDRGYIEIPNSSSLQFNDAASISVWLRVDGSFGQSIYCDGGKVDGNYQRLFAKSGDRYGFLSAIYVQNGYITIRNHFGEGGSIADIAGSIVSTQRTMGEWMHIVNVFDQTGTYIYLDGELISSDDRPAPFNTANQEDLYLGIQLGKGSCLPWWYPLDGVLDEVRIYNRTLSETEIQTLYEQVTYSVSGKVTDNNNNPVADVNISVNNSNNTTTNATGVYTITGLISNTYTISASKDDYEFWPPSHQVKVTADVDDENFYEWICGIDAPLCLQGQPTTPDLLPNPYWYDRSYGNYPANDTTNTIGRWGCNMASNAMVVSYYGEQHQPIFATNPDLLNAWLRTNNGYNLSNGVKYTWITEYSRQNGVQVVIDALEPPDNERLDSHLCTENPVMLRVNGGGHFLLATGKVNRNGQMTYTLNDPKYGYTTLAENYGGNYVTAYYYRYMIGPLRGLVEFSAHSPVHIVVADSQGRKAGYDPRTDTMYDEIPDAGYVTEWIEDSESGKTPESKVLLIPHPIAGEYTLEVIGYDAGAYEISFSEANGAGNLMSEQFVGQAQINSVDVYTLDVEGNISAKIYLPVIVK